ncbi:hypothetical protein CASFOL_034251 [Castilleja foliolosa]|uniref:Serine-threonine/tyrosine-protein kinase catalytic domain-containing protein n=1 Tax=Castilleja foliolosa TaxID=1961234 RepID=A0ABD3BWZ7_9LAMI
MGHGNVAKLWLENGANVDPKDRCGGENIQNSFLRWNHGTQVVVNIFWDGTAEEHKVRRAFRDKLLLLHNIRHPNVVHFLGAVTQSSSMMIDIYQSDLQDYLKRKGDLKPAKLSDCHGYCQVNCKNMWGMPAMVLWSGMRR